MPLNGAILKKTGTNSVAGGTDVTYTVVGQPSQGVQLVDTATADFRVRPSMTCKYKQPTILGGGKYSKDRKSVTIVMPKLLTSGEVAFNLLRIEREVHPESTAAEAAELNCQAAQILFDTDFSLFWSVGSLA